MKSRDSKFYVGGWYSIDFVAWAMELQQPIYLVAVGDFKIRIFEPNAMPKEVELKSVTPGTNALVMEFTGDHFNSYGAKVCLACGQQSLQLPPLEMLWNYAVDFWVCIASFRMNAFFRSKRRLRP